MKSNFPLLDFISRNARTIAKEWFQLVEWLLVMSALAAFQKSSGSIFVVLILIISVAMIWGYVFFSLAEWFFAKENIRLENELHELLLRGAVATGACMVFLLVANLIANLALEFAGALTK